MGICLSLSRSMFHLGQARAMKTKLVALLFGGSICLLPITVLSQASDQVHTPPEGSTDRKAILDALRRNYSEPHKGRLTFSVRYLKEHGGWAWVCADVNSSDPADELGENNGFLLHKVSKGWKVMERPPMVNDPDDPEGLEYPHRADIQKLKSTYPTMPIDIFPARAK